MAFNLKGFAGGLADAGTAYIEGRQSDRKEATTAKRSLMFNATEAIYNNALEIKKSNDKIKNADKQYISKIKSIDPTISTDNMNKLLSLGDEDRLKAEGEYNYRAGQTTDKITFGDFMSAVEESTDLNDPAKIDANIEASMQTAPTPVSAFYDKTGLISDESVNDLYTEITGVLQGVHGFSIDKAKAITEQGMYSVQHPPIKINWSKDIALSKDAMETLARARIYDEAQIKNAGLGILNNQVELTNKSLDAMRDAFSVGYETEQFDDDGNSLGKQAVPASQANMMPNFERDFRNSPEYKQYALTSISSYIVGMETDPKANTENAMTYINGTFPGLYGGKVDVPKLTEKAFAAIQPDKIYYVYAPPVGPANPSGADEEGFILSGAQIKSSRTDVVATDNGGSDNLDPTDVEKNAQLDAEQVIAAANNVQSLKDQGVTLEELGFESWEAVEASMRPDALANDATRDAEDRLQQGQITGGISDEDNVKRMNSEMRTAKGSYRTYLLEQLGDRYIKDYKEERVTPIRELTAYQKVMIDEKRGTIGAAKAYDQAVDIAVQSGDMAAVRKIQSLIAGLDDANIGFGVSDMLDELNAKIEAALNE